MLLDEVLPDYQFREQHWIAIRATHDSVFRAIKRIGPDDVPLFRLLVSIRLIPARLTGTGKEPFASPNLILDQLLNMGFMTLGEAEGQELVLGLVGQFWKLSPVSSRGVSVDDFKSPRNDGSARAAMNFLVQEMKRGDGVKLSTETRVHVPDPTARAKFAMYWRVIHPGSSMIRREWLRAIRRRAHDERE